MFANRKKSDLKRFFNRQLIDETPDLNSSDNENQPPIFSAPMQVDQVYTGNYSFTKLALHLLLGFVPGLVLLSNVRGSSKLALSLGFWMLSIIISIVLLVVRQERFLRRETEKLFHGETQVTLKGKGIKINHVGLATWQEVLSIDSVGRIDQQVCLSILNLGKFKLNISPESFTKLAAPYFEASQRNDEANGNTAEGVLQFKGASFNWPIFFTVFILGCIAGLAAAAFIFEIAHGFTATLFGVGITSFLAASAVWAIPFLRLQNKQYRHPTLFSLEGFALRDPGGKVINLRDAKIVAHREVVPLVYSLTFLSIYPKQGKRIDLWINEPEIRFVVSKLNKLGFEAMLPAAKHG